MLVAYFMAVSPYFFAELTGDMKASTMRVSIPSGFERGSTIIKVRIVEYFNQLAWSPILLNFQSIITSSHSLLYNFYSLTNTLSFKSKKYTQK